jgi:hypothetical protein
MPLVGTRYWEAYRHRLPRGIAGVSSQDSDGESDSLLKLGAHIEETSSLTTDNWHWQLLLSDEVLIPTQLIARLDQLVDFLI